MVEPEVPSAGTSHRETADDRVRRVYRGEIAEPAVTKERRGGLGDVRFAGPTVGVVSPPVRLQGYTVRGLPPLRGLAGVDELHLGQRGVAAVENDVESPLLLPVP